MKSINWKDIFAPQTFAYGLQHLLAMYAGAVVVPIIVGDALGFSPEVITMMVATDIVIAAVATLLQVVSGKIVGIGLPVVFASSATAIGPMIQVGTDYSPGALYGAVLVTGLFIMLLSPVFAKIINIFPPLVTNTIVMLIGATLIPVAINYLAGGEGSPTYGDTTNLAVGLITFLAILLVYRFSKGFMQSIATLIGIIIGMIAAATFGILDFSALNQASWFQLPQPFFISSLEFDLGAILPILIVGIVSMIEATGIYTAASGITDTPLESKDYRKGYFSLGLSYLFAGLFNASPMTAFSQNIGVIQMSGVKKREVIFNLVILMLIAGFIPKIGAVAAAVPDPVLGGAMIFLFGNILSYGISELGKLNLTNTDQIIIGAALTIGVGVTVVPDAFAQLPSWLSWLTSSGIVAGAFTVILMNLFFNGLKKESK